MLRAANPILQSMMVAPLDSRQVTFFEGQMGQLQTGRVEHAVRRPFRELNQQNGRKKVTGVVVAWPLRVEKKADLGRATSFNRLKAENNELRRQVVDLALAIQALRDEICNAVPLARSS